MLMLDPSLDFDMLIENKASKLEIKLCMKTHLNLCLKLTLNM
jgi:hypothetical protein